MIASTPSENLRIPRHHFAEVWREAERTAAHTSDPITAHYLNGVTHTCRWISTCLAPDLWGKLQPVTTPLRRFPDRAAPETINAEYLAAVERGKSRHHHPNNAALIRGVIATLDWLWNANGQAPVEVNTEVAGAMTSSPQS